MNLKYTGAATDMSGYGEAVRHDIAALLSAGVEITTEIPRFSFEITDFGILGDLATNRLDKRIDYKIKIIHVTPNIITKYLEPDKYHIARVIWETTKLPPDFVNPLKNVDEIWTASHYTKKAIENSGVKKPIFVFPEAIDTGVNLDKIQPYVSGQEDTYRFYSMFEWTERKNPAALLEAFWSEFQPDEKVSLTIKTFIDNFHPNKDSEIISYIRKVKNKLDYKDYAPIYLFIKLLDRNQLYRFHKSFDCFVSSHRGEGWGIPQMEAMLVGNPVISTNCGGIHEYLQNNIHAKLVPYKEIPLEGNNRNHQWYLPDQNWADVNIFKLKRAMREVFEDQKRAREIGEKGRDFVKDNFNLSAVGRKMKARLEKIGR